MNTPSEILAQHGLVIVLATDVRAMMDYYQIAESKMHTLQNDQSYERLWEALHEVNLDLGGSRDS